MVAISCWLLGVHGLQSEFGQNIVFARGIFLAGLLSVAMLFWFMYELMVNLGLVMFRVRLPVALLGIAGALGVLTMTTPFIVRSLSVGEGGMPLPLYGDMFWLYIGAVLAVIVVIFLLFIKGLTMAKGEVRSQLISVGATISLAIAAGFATNFLLPALLGDSRIALLNPIAAILLSTGLTYSISRRKLLNFRGRILRAATYMMTVAVLAIVYVAPVIYLLAMAFRVVIPQTQFVLLVLIGTVLSATFHRMQALSSRYVYKHFFRDIYDSTELLRGLNDVLVRTTDLGELLNRSMGIIIKYLHPETCAVVVLQPNEEDRWYVGSGDRFASGASFRSIVVASLESDKDVIGIDDMLRKDPAAAELMRKKGIAVIGRLKSGDGERDACGVLLLGARQTGMVYGFQDRQTVEAVIGSLAVAVQNALHYEEVQRFNRKLQLSVAEATRELRSSNRRLTQIDKAKDEFLSLASHQLRTPLTSIKGYISMVLEGDAGKITSQQRQLLDEAYASSERMVHLIGDFLNVSRLQTGRFMVDYHQVDLAKVVAQEVESMRAVATAHDMTIILKISSLIPMLYIDEGKLRQVIMNFIDNSIYYSPDSREVTVSLGIEDGAVVFRVADAGMGVPKDAQKNLFTKFYRAENARRQRPDGTGIGLYLAKKIVDAHSGSIVFESEEGEGSTFGFRLPIKKLSTLPTVADEPVLDRVA